MTELEKARTLLATATGKRISTVEISEFDLRITFDDRSHFVTQSPWRVRQKGVMLFGNGDWTESTGTSISESLKNVAVISTEISDSWDTRLELEHHQAIEILVNSLAYEMWEFHTSKGWSIFIGGALTTFSAVEKTS